MASQQLTQAQQRHERDLLELTSLPTAAGREDVVIQWIERWVKRRRSVSLDRDRFGNLMLSRSGGAGEPIVLAAHMDHPAFVVVSVDSATLEADFRGGVLDAYFQDAAVRLWRRDQRGPAGVITHLTPADDRTLDKRVSVRFKQAVDAQPGDVLTWDLPAAQVRQGRLHAPACDDLAGVAAALAAFDEVGRRRARHQPDVRLLLTRAEEVGFAGAIAACGSGIIPKSSRIIALENSKSFAESPIGGGAIVRVGDRTSTFDPTLTYAVTRIAQTIAEDDKSFRFQRKLMPGGTCEATAYQALGYTATCLCLPLGNYHNMNEEAGRIDRESIALSDFHGLVRLLVESAARLDHDRETVSLTDRLTKLFEQRKALLQ